MQLIDTHTHLNLDEYVEDQTQVITRALDAGLVRMVTPGVTLESSLSSVLLSEKYPGQIYFALGIHPNDVSKGSGWSPEVASRFRELAAHPALVAIGETGLDYYWDDSPPEAQHQALREQIQLARELKLPIIIHVRDKAGSTAAYDDLLLILKAEKAAEVGGVMHCFSGTLEFAKASLDLNFDLAFGGVLTFKNARELQEVAKQVPLERIVLETDSPYLAPMPYRGKRNEPAYVRLVADKLAELRGLEPEFVAETTTANARRLFKF
jgi:TatD DNase family protein